MTCRIKSALFPRPSANRNNFHFRPQLVKITGMTTETESIPRASEKESASAASAPPDQQSAAPANGEHVDWLTKELGRRPTWEERLERARAAAKRLGYPKGPPSPPIPRRTPEEHAAMVAKTNRLREAIRKELGPWRFKSVQFFRDLRDGKMKDDSAYWWRVDEKDDNAGN